MLLEAESVEPNASHRPRPSSGNEGSGMLLEIEEVREIKAGRLTECTSKLAKERKKQRA